jgi:hypothetical protein
LGKLVDWFLPTSRSFDTANEIAQPKSPSEPGPGPSPEPDNLFVRIARFTQAVNEVQFAALLCIAGHELAQKNYAVALDLYTQLRAHEAFETMTGADPALRELVFNGANRSFLGYLREQDRLLITTSDTNPQV